MQTSVQRAQIDLVLPKGASAAEDKEALFDPSDDKIYRHPTFYSIPDDVKHM